MPSPLPDFLDEDSYKIKRRPKSGVSWRKVVCRTEC